MLVRTDCRYFRGDLPCSPNKERGVVCEVCPEFAPRGKRVLIIKLDAMGDVLRTTCVVEPILRQFPDASITWITASASTAMLRGIPGISEILPHHGALPLLMTTDFDLALGLDPSLESARLLMLARAHEKRGFGLDRHGSVTALNEGAREWYEMGLFDSVKKANIRTYQSLIQQAAELPEPIGRILFSITEADSTGLRSSLDDWKLEAAYPILGLNTGSGGRWPNKRWPTKHWRTLMEHFLVKHANGKVLLLGGPEEIEEQAELASGWPHTRVIPTGCDHPIREFAAVVDLCDAVVTGDTLGLHLSLALKKRVVALFGPTSASEIEMYDLGTRVDPTEPCKCFYRKSCTQTISCLEGIPPVQVVEVLERELQKLQPREHA